ncbi:MAG: hypothetical protein HYU75_20695, partial [Betaproteobacteria bacterium]|nr:hypothetical protein [Betaproteobacteria bacterium]
PHDPDSVNWALVYRMQPDRDLRVTPGKGVAMDPSAAHPSLEREVRQMPYGSAVMINATRKWEYPPVSLPKKEFMERARRIWEEEGLPPLAPKVPWFGTSLGYWTQQDEEEAELALKGEHFQTGKKMEQGRKRI